MNLSHPSAVRYSSLAGVWAMVKFRISFFLTGFLADTFFVDISGRPWYTGLLKL